MQGDVRGLPRIDIDIPFTVQIDIAPLLAAAGRAETEGGWYGLRERPASGKALGRRIIGQVTNV